VRAIVAGGLAVGLLDTVLAIVQYRVGPERVYRGVASGLLGPGAREGGLEVPALGMALHFFIATCWAAGYVLASRKARVLAAHPLPFGLAYGIFVYFFMKQVVVPLSAARPAAFSWVGLVGHAFLVGLPIALAARYAGPAKTTVTASPGSRPAA
jgi:hypothetical protein